MDLSVIDPTSSLVLEANASDPDGTIKRVDFFAGTTLIGSSATAPYRFIWINPAKGQLALSAQAIDNRSGEANSNPITVRLDQAAGSVAVLTGGDDPDLALLRRYLFELPVRWRLIPHAEANSDELLRQYGAVLWHQPGGAELQSPDLKLLESLAQAGTPLYFLGDSLLASSRRLPSAERERWQNLIHLKPGGSGWLNQITILDEANHPVIRNGPAGSVARFTYPITLQQAGLQTGGPGEVVLGRSGTFDILVAAVEADSAARTFTHHLRLSGAADALGAAEQAKLFQNAISWLLDKQTFVDLSVEVEPPAGPVVVGQTFQYRIVIRHSGESPANQVAIIDALPPEINLVRVEAAAGTWSLREGTATFEIGHLAGGETKTILVTAVATRPGSFSHLVQVQMSGRDAVQENNTFNASITVGDGNERFPRLIIRRENQGMVRIELSGAEVGATYTLEASGDLVHWSRLNVGFTGPSLSTTLSAALAPRQFFRAVSADPRAAIPPAAQP